MSVDPGEQLRDHVVAELSQLTTAGGPASPNSTRATHLVYRNEPARALLHKKLIDAHLADAIGGGGAVAVITAGAAGAGKSTAIDTVLGSQAALYRRLDADVVKDALLTDASQTGLFDDLLAITLSDGRPVVPRELASLVHHESIQIWDALRRHSIDRGEPIIIEGTLTWPPLGPQLLNDLRRGGYVKISVIAVEVPQQTAQQRAVDRWWQVRQSATDSLGGRFTPPDVVTAAYQPDGTSACLTNAEALVSRARKISGITVTFDIIDENGDRTTR